MKRWAMAAGIFVVILLALSVWSIRTTSITIDETYYLSCGLQSVHDGHLDPRIVRHGVAPLPVVLNYLLPMSFAPREERPSPWTGQTEDAELITGPRTFNALLFGGPIVIAVSLWLYKRRGPGAAITGAALSALSPSILAHSALATTDAAFALFVILALAAIAIYFKQPTRKHFLLMALSIAAAMSAKYAGVFLLPVVFILLMVRIFPAAKGTTLTRFALLILLILPLWWAFHIFSLVGPLDTLTKEQTHDPSMSTIPLGHGPVAEWLSDLAKRNITLPAPIIGTAFQYLHNREGHTAFLNGQHSQSGWWYYYAFAFLYKSTPAELAIALLLIACLAAAFRSPLRSFQDLDAELQTLCLAALIFTTMLLTSHIDIGQRYLLTLYPVLIILGIDRLWNRFGMPGAAVIAALLIGGQLWSCLGIAPHFLSYFNGFVGGPQQGWKLLADSNIDWGQDLPALQHELQKRNGARVALSYFGTALPAAYGVHADPAEKLPQPAADYNVIAISVTHLQGLYGTGDQPFRKFLSLEPAGRAGYSIFLYDLSDAKTKAAFQSAIELINTTAHPPATGQETLSLYAFTMTLMASQDFENLDIFDLCYAEMFRDPSAAPSQLLFVEERLKNAAQPTDYKTRFRLAILRIARWTLLPRVAIHQDPAHWPQAFDYDLFREDYSESLKLLNGSAEIGIPLIEALKKTAGRIDEDGDGKFSDAEITAFLLKK